MLIKAAINSILKDKKKYVFEYIWLKRIDKHDIKNDIALNVLKNPSLIISLSPIKIADMNSTTVINIQAMNKNDMNWNVTFFLINWEPHCIMERNVGIPITQLSYSLSFIYKLSDPLFLFLSFKEVSSESIVMSILLNS